jgi:uncharacterized membrane protein YeaQ/YmgE (transglycosylase-associated protein family)
MKGAGYDLVMNIMLGVIGGFFGGRPFVVLGLTSTGVLSLVTSTVGLVALIFGERLLKK